MLEIIDDIELEEYFKIKLGIQNEENKTILKNRQLINEAVNDILVSSCFAVGGGICKICGELNTKLINDTCEDCIQQNCL